MTSLVFFQTAAAAFFGVVLASVFLWALWKITRLERTGWTDRDIPLRLYLVALVPLTIVIWATYHLS